MTVPEGMVSCGPTDGSDPTAVAAALSRLLTDCGLHHRQVRLTGTESAGANRLTHLIEIEIGDRGSTPVIDAVAQIRTPSSQPTDMLPMAREATLVRTLAPTAVPVAEILASGRCSQLGGEVVISRFVAGETIPRKVLRLLSTSDHGGEAMAAVCGRVLAELHGRPPFELLPNAGVPTPSDLASNYLDGLEERLDSLDRPRPTLRYAIRALE